MNVLSCSSAKSSESTRHGREVIGEEALATNNPYDRVTSLIALLRFGWSLTRPLENRANCGTMLARVCRSRSLRRSQDQAGTFVLPRLREGLLGNGLDRVPLSLSRPWSDAEKVALAYSLDTKWRNRADFANGRDEARAFLARKWNKELDYRLIKELWAFDENRIAVRYAYEWRDDSGNWFRSYGNENWEFGPDGLMHHRYPCINDAPIKESERKFHWPLGRRPDDHPGLSELGL